MSIPRVAVVVQARTNSRRLPGKVLQPLAGAPAIVRMMERVGRIRRAQCRVVATSDHPADDLLARVVEDHGICVTRGPRDDVLARLLMAAPAEFDTVVRLTGDCPLVDPALVDHHIEVFARHQPWAEYVTNAVVRTQPDGLDVEVVARNILTEADRHATTAFDREHVLPWVRRRARMVPVTQEIDLSSLRWTLDTAGDYAVIAKIFDMLYQRNPAFGSADVYDLLVRWPELIRVEGRAQLDRGELAAWAARIRAHLSGAVSES